MLSPDPGLRRLHQRVYVLEKEHLGLFLYRLQTVGEYGVVPLLQEVPQYRLVFSRPAVQYIVQETSVGEPDRAVASPSAKASAVDPSSSPW
jgi:hypothetical protein